MKAAKRAVLSALKAAGVFALLRRQTQRQVRILCYHNAWRGADGFGGDSMFILPQTFAARLALMERLGFTVVALDHAVAGLKGERPLPDCPVVITIDDGWYGTYADMAPLLARHRMPATLYCDTASLLKGLPVAHVMARYVRRIHCAGRDLPPEAEAAYARAIDRDLPEGREGNLAALDDFARHAGIDLEPYFARRVFSYMTPDELRAARGLGLSVELHTHNHSLHAFAPPEVESEIRLNRAALGELLDAAPEAFRHFCYPSGLTAPGVCEILDRIGIASATTLLDGLAAPGADALLLPRLLDGDHLSPLEFEAELCGVGDLLRGARRLVRGQTGRAPAMVPAAG